MKMRSLVATANIGFLFLPVLGSKGEAAELKMLSAFGMQSVMEDLGPKFERATGHKLAISFATGGATVKRVQDGDAADVVITLRQGIDTLVKDGKASAGNVTVLARSGIVVVVRKGAPKPDVSSPDALNARCSPRSRSPMSIQRAAAPAGSISPKCSTAWGSPTR
jgi:molybdate transport system substrate-binding protein